MIVGIASHGRCAIGIMTFVWKAVTRHNLAYGHRWPNTIFYTYNEIVHAKETGDFVAWGDLEMMPVLFVAVTSSLFAEPGRGVSETKNTLLSDKAEAGSVAEEAA